MNASRAHAAAASQRKTCVPAPHCSGTAAATSCAARQRFALRWHKATAHAQRACPRGASSTVTSIAAGRSAAVWRKMLARQAGPAWAPAFVSCSGAGMQREGA
jgi:hypothetical protein